MRVTGSARRASIALVVASCAALSGCAVGPLAVGREHDEIAAQARVLDELARQSDAVIAEFVPEGGAGCSAAVGRDGTVLWAGAGGLADIAAGIPNTPQTRFEIASLSKQFTATAILMLQRDGALSVADPIGRYVDGLPDWADTVTLDQLIHHTSRIPDYWVELDEEDIKFATPADQATIIAAIAREEELDDDGEGFLYSNSNYVLLAEVAQRVTGAPLSEFLQARIFEPLGLAMVLSPGLTGPDIALPYTDDSQLYVGGWTAQGAIGIITTPSELVRWGDQYRAGDIIQDDFAAGAVYEAEGEYYAAGMDIEVDGDLNHTGLWGGYVSEFTVSEDRRTTIAVTCNAHNGQRFPIAEALWAIWRPHGA